MADIHIDDFYKDTAKIFIALYNSFPRKITVYVEDISGPDTPDEFGLHSERHQACFSAMLWLAENGYLTYLETIRQEAIDQVTLTHKAFTLLSTRATHATDHIDSELHDQPASVQEASLSNINQLRSVIRKGSSNSIRHMIQQLLLQARHFQ